MYDQEQIIQIYRQGFFICAGLSVVGGIMTTIFFWKFGIRRIMQYPPESAVFYVISTTVRCSTRCRRSSLCIKTMLMQQGGTMDSGISI